MINHLDSLVDIIAPEMPGQVARWGGTVSGLEENVQELRDFILERCSDQFVEGMEDCYDVEAMDVTIIIDGEGIIKHRWVAESPGVEPDYDAIIKLAESIN